MAAITDLSDLVNRMTGGNNGTPEFMFDHIFPRIGSGAATAPIAKQWSSLWKYNKVRGGNGANPTTVAVPTNATAGALKQTNPGGGRQKWLTGCALAAGINGIFVLYDRLLHIGGLSGTVTTAQNVGGSLTRYTNGLGNEIWLEIYTQIGATTRNIVANYTNQDDNAAVTPNVVIGNTGFREAERILRMPLAEGDTGVKGVTSVDLDGSTGTAGNFGVTVAHPLLMVPITSNNGGQVMNLVAGLPAMKEILTDACLAWIYYPFGTVAPDMFYNLNFVEA